MKDILDYTKEDLEKLSTEELQKMADECSEKSHFFEIQQLVQKIMINSLYGAISLKHFILFNAEIAKAITGNGRFLIKNTAKAINKKLNEINKSENQNFYIYSDTDSCVGSTLIRTSDGLIKIEDIFNNSNSKIELANNSEVKKVENLKAYSVSEDLNLELNKIVYVMKHKVKKRMFKIKVNGKEVEITEDHSIMVLRNNKLISIKPKDILKTDKLITFEDLKSESNFEILDLGEKEIDVYDIEVENNHNFFGNDILIHNSVYFSLGPIMEKIFEKRPDLSLNDKVDAVDKFELNFIAPVVNETIKKVCDKLNATKPDVIGCKREGIFDAFIAIQKKKYIARERDDEGTRYPETEPKMKRMGVELTKAQTCPFSKIKLLESLNIIFDKSEEYLTDWIEEQRSLFYKEKIENISNYGSISKDEYDLSDKNVPYLYKAAMLYNKYVKDNNLQKYYQLFRPGDKCRVVFLKTPNPIGNERLVFTDVKFAELFDEYIDYETSFDKFFISPLQNMAKALGFNLEKKVATFDEW